MTANKATQDSSLVNSIESEVAPEASPLLAFLVNHARTIALLLVLVILGIAGYWIYLSRVDAQKEEDALALGKILVIHDTSARYTALQEYLASAPESMRREALFAAMDTANIMHDMQKIHDSWQAIGDLDPALKVPSGMGMAGALAEQGKYKEALAPLETLVPSLKGRDVILVNARIAALAEIAGDIPRAIAACDAMIASPFVGEEAKFWAQKRFDLERKARTTVQ